MTLSNLCLLGQNDGSAAVAGGIGILMTLFWLAFIVVIIASMWKVFEKAGKPGWAAIVPFYNMIVILEIVGRPVWWIVLMLIPCVSFVIGIIVFIDLAKSFGKDTGYGLGLAFLGFIFFPMLAFSDAKYRGPVATP